MKQSSGIPTFDTFIEGGLEPGDNVVWITEHRSDADRIMGAFLGVAPSGDGTARVRRSICMGDPAECGHEPPGATESLRHVIIGDGDAAMVSAESAFLADDLGEGSRVVISALDDIMERWGSEATVDLYRRTCPRLFDRGAIAYWVGTREVLGPSVIDRIARIAQCVFEIRDDRLRVLKAEGRSSWLQGAMVDIDTDGPEPEVSREHAVGRLGEGLRRLRAERGLTQAQMAELARVTPAAVSQAETGRRGLSLDTLVPLVEALGIGLDDLLGTGRRRGPFIARPDRRPSLRGTALFDDPDVGPRVHLVEIAGGERQAVPLETRGTELVVVSEGLVMVDLGDTTPVLRAHDALMVTEESVLSFTNLGGSVAQLFWIAL